MEFSEYFSGKKALITGGCGFVGSHIIDKLVELDIASITVIDDLSAGTSTKYLDDYDNVTHIQEDIREFSFTDELDSDFDMIIHLAAQPSVPVSVERPYFDFEVNMIGSIRLLEFARKHNIGEFVFAASGGTVYGEAEKMPTPEFYPLRPISNYGAAKAAVEMYLKSYAVLYGIKTTSMRFGNVYGPRSGHGVMFDFYHKLHEDPATLEILGNGLQEKSYLYISDCVSGFLHATSRESSGFAPFNMAAKPPVSVNEIADLMAELLGIEPEYHYTGGDRGWKGDVRKGELDVTALKRLGWSQKVPIKEGMRRYIEWLENNVPI